MNSFLGQLREGLRRCGIQQERLLVGVSGGADSVALLRGLIVLSPEFYLELIPAHLNHGLRGIDSEIDAEFVKSLAGAFDLPSEIGRVTLGDLAANQSALEESARNLRHQFLADSALKRQCSKIVLAHHQDDQSETVLHHVLRGTGISGLRGIPQVRDTPSGVLLVRPMLAIRRTVIEDFLRDCGQEFRTDTTNDDLALTRNKLRHVVLPMLRAQINPQVDTALWRLAEQAAEMEEFLRSSARDLLKQSLLDRQFDACRLDASVLAHQPRHLVRELFRELWIQQNWPLQAMGFEQWNRMLDILKTRETTTFPNRIEARFHAENLLVLRRLF